MLVLSFVLTFLNYKTSNITNYILKQRFSFKNYDNDLGNSSKSVKRLHILKYKRLHDFKLIFS